MDVRKLYDINLMYQHYKRGEPIDKKRLIEILRKTESLDDYLFSIAELTSFLADCLDDDVYYELKSNKKKIRDHELLGTLPYMIAHNFHTKKTGPKARAYQKFADMHNCGERHVKELIKKAGIQDRLDYEVNQILKWLKAEEEKS